jgi:tellurite resistance protein TerC
VGSRASGALEYYTGYLVELTLAMDNVFVISLILAYFAVPRGVQHRVLFWGIVGVIVLRAIMIGLGAALVSNFGLGAVTSSRLPAAHGVKMLHDALKGKEAQRDLSGQHRAEVAAQPSAADRPVPRAQASSCGAHR